MQCCMVTGKIVAKPRINYLQQGSTRIICRVLVAISSDTDDIKTGFFQAVCFGDMANYLFKTSEVGHVLIAKGFFQNYFHKDVNGTQHYDHYFAISCLEHSNLNGVTEEDLAYLEEYGYSPIEEELYDEIPFE